MRTDIFIFCAVLCSSVMVGCSEDDAVVTPEKVPVTLNWSGVTINLDESPTWCLTRSNSSVALTNYRDKSQYYIVWDGGMSPGPKTNAELKISTDGGKPETQKLTAFEISTDGVNYTYSFSGDNGVSGTFTFPIDEEL